MEIKISVVIPTYKREKLLLNALDALSNQHFSNTRFEVIVVHDGPYSWSQDFLQARAGFPFSFWVLNTESKKGPAATGTLAGCGPKASLLSLRMTIACLILFG